jgi:Protein of unknown function (DUF2934)
MQTLPQEDPVAHRAYEIWEAEGRPDGRHLEHWRQAEEEFATHGNRAGTPEADGPADDAVPGDADSATPAI